MITFLESTDSTNNCLWEMLRSNPTLPDGTCVCAAYQTAGRGQTGNSWESEAWKNLLFSTLLRVEDLMPQNQFLLNELVSVGIARVLRTYIPDVCVKWPNDIYYHNSKLSGILIEGQISGRQLTAIAGIGLNVNQTRFLSNAFNPVSMKQITNRDYDIRQLLEQILAEFRRLRSIVVSPQELKAEYMQLLYRKDGYHLYEEAGESVSPMMPSKEAVKNQFMAKIVDITAQGALVLETIDGTRKTYNFKQIRYIINDK